MDPGTMKYLLAIFLPPLAVLACGRPFLAVINLGLTLLLWVPGVIHAFVVVAESNAEERTNRLARAYRRSALR